MPFEPDEPKSGFVPDEPKPTPEIEEGRRLKGASVIGEAAKGFIGGIPESAASAARIGQHFAESFKLYNPLKPPPPTSLSQLAGEAANIIQAPFTGAAKKIVDTMVAQGRTPDAAAFVATIVDVLGPQAAVELVPGVGATGSAVARGIGRKAIGRLGQKEVLQEAIAREAAERGMKAQGLAKQAEQQHGMILEQAEEAQKAGQVVPLAQEEAQQARAELTGAQTTQETARQNLMQAKQAPMPPPLPQVQPEVAQATQRLREFPLQVEPTTRSLKELGQSFVGTEGEPGLFRMAAQGVKDNLSKRVESILGPRGTPVSDLTPLRNAAQSVLPEVRASRLQTPPQSIASGIISATEKAPLDELTKAELVAEDFDNALKALPPGTPISLGNVINLRDYKTTAQAFKALYMSKEKEAIMPSIHEVQAERTIIRALKRAADKAGHPSLYRDLSILEDGYTGVLEQSLGKEGSTALRQWDRDYKYAVENLFGYKSQPFKFSRKKAEDFATGLFKRSGEQQEERVNRVLELLGPDEKPVLGQGLLQVITSKSQKEGLPFDPTAWGKEYLSYKDGVREAVFSPQHKRDLDEIARIFRQAPLRQEEREAARQAEIETRRGRIASVGREYEATQATTREAGRRAGEAQQVLSATERRARETERTLRGTESELGRTERELRRTQKYPTDKELESMRQLKELSKPRGLQKLLESEQWYAGRRGLFAIGALLVGGGHWGPMVAEEAGSVILGTLALERLLANDRGARLIRMLAQERPGTANAARLGVLLNQTMREMSGGGRMAPTEGAVQ